MEFLQRELSELAIEDEPSMRHVALYDDLRDVLVRARYRFRVLPEALRGRWDRALLLNLTFWSASAGGDVLPYEELSADVVTHVAWHHLAATALPSGDAPPSPAALFLGESIASAFDVYLVGRLLGHAPESSFLQTQVPAMADAAEDAGLDEDAFAALLSAVADQPERAFEDLRQLLFDATSALHACRTAEDALVALARFEEHRFASLLSRFELSNWVLYARAHGADEAEGADARAIDAALRAAPSSLEWLEKEWVRPALAEKTAR